MSDFCFNNAVQQASPIAQQCSVNRASSVMEHRLLSSVASGSHSGTSDYLENPASIANGRCTRELGKKSFLKKSVSHNPSQHHVYSPKSLPPLGLPNSS